ncbi:MAG: T9SS C-terminal target domain-containing protein [Saprospirales bacterium]|nr:MAG: T9SS C-terminal target domain-containing protein [Saprospirales bacterium]
MVNSLEGIAMYEEMMVEMPPHIDSLDWVDYIETYMWFYYGHEYYQTFYPEVYQVEIDTSNEGMCFNGVFQESNLSDDHVKGFQLFTGLAYPDELCSFDHVQLMNLPLPENSTPDDPLFPFNLNPYDNESTDDFPGYKSFSSVELFLEGSGPDLGTELINSNPPSGNRSIRLNRGGPQFSGWGMVTTMERKFKVDPLEPLFTIGFAFVANHAFISDSVGLPPVFRPSLTLALIADNGHLIKDWCFSMQKDESDFEVHFFSSDLTTWVFIDWNILKEDLTSYIGEDVTLRIVSSHAPWSSTRDWGFAYVSDICIEDGGYPAWEVDLGNSSLVCPFNDPTIICNKLSYNDSIFTIEGLYLEIVHSGETYHTELTNSIDSISGEVCFELERGVFTNLPKKGYDIYTVAEIRHNFTDSTFLIRSKSYTPNTYQDFNNDLLITCCPEVLLDTLDLCDPHYVDLCGRIELDSCELDIISFTLEVIGSDTLFLIDLEVDSLSEFCYQISDSLITAWEEYCVRGIIELIHYDELLEDTVFIISEFYNENGACLLEESCCPQNDTVSISVNRILCLTGSDYSEATFDISGSFHFGNFPDGFKYCGNPPEFVGGYIDYLSFAAYPNMVQFEGIFHIPDPSGLNYDPAQDKYYLTGTMVVCDGDNECEIDIIISFSTSQPDMCFNMEGLMCMNFIVNTAPYNPQVGGPPVIIGDRVWLPLSLGVPFVDKYINEGDTCAIDTYWFQIFGVDGSDPFDVPDLLHQSMVEKLGNESTGIFQEQIYIPISDWNSYTHIDVTFWNNCGDTCTARSIPVIPVEDNKRELQEFEIDDYGVEIVPNPFGGDVRIDYKLSDKELPFRVFDASGKQISTGVFSERKGQYFLNSSHWPSGWYVLHVLDKKLEKQNFILIKD